MSLIGRADSVARILDAVLGPTPVTLLTGPAGVGRSAVLAEVARATDAGGLVPVRIRVTRHDRAAPRSVSARLAGAVSRLTPGSRATDLPALLTAQPGLVVLIDDVHLMDDASRTELEDLARTLAPGTVRWVGTARTPVRPVPRLPALLTDRLARIVPLAPLSRAAAEDLVAEVLGARPHALLSARLHRMCRGLPAAIVALLADWRRSGALHVSDGHAYLLAAPVAGTPAERPGRLDEPMWTVAKAAAVLHPAGTRLPELATLTSGLDVAGVRSALGSLVAEGLLVPWTGGWRFAARYWADAFDRSLAPYERGELARILVEAVWEGGVSAPPAHFAEQLMRGGGARQPERAGAELESLGLLAIRRNAVTAIRRLTVVAAAETERPPRYTTMAGAAGASAAFGDYDAALRGTRSLLQRTGSGESDVDVLEASLVHVAALWGNRDDAITDVAEGRREFGRTPGHRLICRALALSCVGRQAEAYRLLDADRAAWQRDEGREHGRVVLAAAGALTGRPAGLRDLVERAGHAEPDRSHPMMIRIAVRTLLLLGDTVAVQRLLRRERLSVEEFPAQDRVLLTWQIGQWNEAMHHVRRAAAGPDADVPHGFMALLLGRGRLTAARQAVADARNEYCPMPHLLDAVDAMIARILGDDDLARRRVREGLAQAAARGTVAGTEELQMLTAQLFGPEQAHAAAEAAERIADLQQTDRSRLLALLTRLSVEPSAATAAEAVTVARRLGQPWMLSVALAAVVETGGDPGLLPEAYGALDGLDALLDRYRLRGLMRRHNVPVPNRAATVSENDRLLATLVADGASNRELATVLMTSARSVEGMLTRLFTRTGYRSRIDLAAAVLTGEFPTT
ncbi:hypothetical protein JIG36_29385 [Actinoplanes sp. LDG1-06]|uniref:HTH luxR-type domain-containing protein n=1 Tax=Paractinoplanes ovalisporus TaxID=2810368 RepID=A0ABS2AII6_9ACTN|nr:AAA family ATPase [Actinoplanes ovalisporus]MBM2619663.1 hypothetical protein [Actinoplanes ovalisporus]